MLFETESLDFLHTGAKSINHYDMSFLSFFPFDLWPKHEARGS